MDRHSFAKVSPFLINKLVKQAFGTITGLSNTSKGCLLDEASSKNQSDKIINTMSLGGFTIKAEMHKMLNPSRGMGHIF